MRLETFQKQPAPKACRTARKAPRGSVGAIPGLFAANQGHKAPIHTFFLAADSYYTRNIRYLSTVNIGDSAGYANIYCTNAGDMT